MVEISPSGRRVVTHYGRCWGGEVVLLGVWAREGEGEWSLPYKKAVNGNSVINSLKLDAAPLPKKGKGGAGPGWFADPGRDRIHLQLPGSDAPKRHRIAVTYGSRSEAAGSVWDGAHAWDLDFSHPVKISVGETHSGWAFDSAGGEWFVSQNNRTDWIEARDLARGRSLNVISHADLGWGNGFHIGKFYNKEHAGWCLLSTYSKTDRNWGENQILMVQLKPSEQKPVVWRISPTYNRYDGKYRDEAPAALAHDGQSVWWSANWGEADGTSEVYRVALPDRWQEVLVPARKTGRP